MARNSLDCPKGQFGPIYTINCAAKFRKRDGALRDWSFEERQAYGAAVEAAILAAQASALRRTVVEPRPNCASGTWINTNDGAIGAAIRAKHNAALLNCPGNERRARSPDEWASMYAEAMPEGFVPSWEREPAELRRAA